jgi:uncharacterized protein YajQ (UPF0234 family)
VLLVVLQDDFNQNKYDAQRRALFQQLYSKNRAATVMKVDDAEEGNFRIKGPLEPTADCAGMNHAQLVNLLKDEASSKDAMQQELSNFAQAKRASQECKRLADESELNKEQLMQSSGQHRRKLQLQLEEAHEKLKNLQKMYEDLKVKAQLQLDQNGVVAKKRDEFRGLLTKSQQPRKLEQETTIQMQIELDEAYDHITQLNSELHDTSVIDDRVGSPQLSGALDSSMTYSDMKASPTNITAAPKHKVPALVSESPRSTVSDNADQKKE